MSNVIQYPQRLAIGMHAMGCIADNRDRPTTLQEITDTFSVSLDHLVRVMQQLRRSGLVDSIRGPSGGYVLARPADKITLFNVFEALEGPVAPHGCLFQKTWCTEHLCPLGACIRKLEIDFIRYMKSSPLTVFSRAIKQEKNHRPQPAAK